MELAKAMKAKRGSRYREYKDWLGGHYDVNTFDLEEVNEQLAETRLLQYFLHPHSGLNLF